MSTNGPLSHQDLEAALRTRLVQSGEYSKVMERLRTRLNESNWNDQVRDLAREESRGDDSNSTNPPHLTQLLESIEPRALDLIPQEVRQEIQAMVHEFVKKSVE
ncbi:Sus1p [Sporobolomyces koalae]|uniref:Sus1p n=1 Tax=Sporobolomyces koalae TaxID=500713 RepID=UPI003182025D